MGSPLPYGHGDDEETMVTVMTKKLWSRDDKETVVTVMTKKS